MKLLTRETDYAVRILALGASSDGVLTAAGVSQRLRLPGAFSRRLLQMMARKGLVMSSRGHNGGFRLSRPADKISLLDVALVFQPVSFTDACMFKKENCPRKGSCVIRKTLAGLERDMRSAFSRLTMDRI